MDRLADDISPFNFGCILVHLYILYAALVLTTPTKLPEYFLIYLVLGKGKKNSLSDLVAYIAKLVFFTIDY